MNVGEIVIVEMGIEEMEIGEMEVGETKGSGEQERGRMIRSYLHRLVVCDISIPEYCRQ